MSTEQEMTVLVRGKLESMKELQRLLQKRGIPSEIRRPDEKGCNTG